MRVSFLLAGIFLFGLIPLEASAQNASISNGLSYLRSTQSPDGSWGGTASSSVDIIPSTTAAIEILRLLETAPTSQQALGRAYLAGLILEETDFIARRISALAGTSSAVASDRPTLLIFQNRTGGLGFSTDNGFGGAAGYGSDVLDTSLALQGLASVQSTDAAAIGGAVGYLLSAQNLDGGWGFASGQESQIYYTAFALQALQTQPRTAALSNALFDGTNYLLARQQADGSWGGVTDTALSFSAVVGATTNINAMISARQSLSARQQPDGSWLQDPYATALALRALNDAKVLDQDIDHDGDGFTERQGDCNDANPAIHPGAADTTVNGIDEDCDGRDGPPPPASTLDHDKDGFSPAQGDCDDNNQFAFPSAVDFTADGIDQNCDGRDGHTVGSIDFDADGFSYGEGDCNDSNPNIHPGAVDIPDNGIDEDCNDPSTIAARAIESITLFKVVNGQRVPSNTFHAHETGVGVVKLAKSSVSIGDMAVIGANGNYLVYVFGSGNGEFTFNTRNHLAGIYTATASALASSGVRLEVFDFDFIVLPTVSIGDLAAAIFPSVPALGATEELGLKVGFVNKSNVATTFTAVYEVIAPSGAVIHSASSEISTDLPTPLVQADMTKFTHTFTEEGGYRAEVQIKHGTESLAQVVHLFSVFPGSQNGISQTLSPQRIEAEKTVTPQQVTPDADKRIRMKIHLEGVFEAP